VAKPASPFLLPRHPPSYPRDFILGTYVTEIGPKASPAGHTFPSVFAYSHTIMRGAFVVQLGPETKPTDGRFEGWAKEVDSCTEMRFRSVEELVKFLGQRFDLARALVDETQASNKSTQVSPKKKTSRKDRGSP